MAGDFGANSKDKFSLNLYPMIDIFSILICFLLMNFSTQGESVETRKGLELPRSEVRMSLDTAATVSISQTDITVQSTVTIPIMANGDVAESELLQGGLKRAYTVLQQVRASNETLKNRNQALGLSEAEIDTLTLEADKKTTFQLIKRVMLTAQQADFISWKLAVDKSSID
jgi:biopolymer transport protein ExbD